MPPRESPEAKYDRLKKLLQDSILKEYPNPERKGCPGSPVLQELAERVLDETVQDDPQWHHVTHCSECYREFLAFNVAFRGQAKARQARFAWGLAAAALLIVGVIVGLTYERFFPSRPQNAELAFQRRVVDLQGRSITRSGAGNQEAKPIILKNEPEELTIRLPFGSEAGTYEVQLLKTADQPLSSTAGKAAIQDGMTTLIAKLDLSKLEKGGYFLGIRKIPSDWTYYPVQIR